MNTEYQFIYVLKLNNGKWYVGATNNLAKRIANHRSKEGSQWVKLHGFLELVKVTNGKNTSEKDLTLEYMVKYGWQNVRGAAWTARNLSKKPAALK